MDCTIPAHSIRMFCASIGACAKLGKDLYLSFDALEGLSLSTLNDPKSAFLRYTFEPSFFTHCTGQDLDILNRENNNSSNNNNNINSRSQSTARRRTRKRNRPTPAPNNDNHDDMDDEEDTALTCRLSIRALTAAVRQRKNAQSLRLYMEEKDSALFLCWEYLLGGVVVSNNNPNPHNHGLTVVHRVKVTAFPVNIVTATVTDTGGMSEMVVAPRVLLRLLEPLSRTAETSLVVSNVEDHIVATCFSPQSSGTTNVLTKAQMQTEMRLSLDDLDAMEFVDSRDTTTTSDDDDDDDTPTDVNERVTLVFSHRECKALLQWAVEHVPCRVQFQWGGQPLVVAQHTDQWKASLVLATLHYSHLVSAQEVSRNTTTTTTTTVRVENAEAEEAADN